MALISTGIAIMVCRLNNIDIKQQNMITHAMAV